jgi:hypothetical protein
MKASAKRKLPCWIGRAVFAFVTKAIMITSLILSGLLMWKGNLMKKGLQVKNSFHKRRTT